MNPMGHVQDINSLRKQGYVIESALSPDVCLEIVKDLNSPKGKGMSYTVQGWCVFLDEQLEITSLSPRVFEKSSLFQRVAVS